MQNEVRSWVMWVACGLAAGGALGLFARPAAAARDPLALSESQHFKVRLAAVRLLARSEDHRSALRLHAMLEDDHPLVRRVAEHSLQRRDAATALCAPVADLGR